MAVTVTLEDEIDVSRGDMLVPVNNLPTVGHEFEAMMVWMHHERQAGQGSYLVKHTTNLVPGVLADIRYQIDVNTLRREPEAADSLALNEVGRVHVTLHRPLAFDSYRKNRVTGAFVLIDRVTNATVGAGMIVDRAVHRTTTTNRAAVTSPAPAGRCRARRARRCSASAGSRCGSPDSAAVASRR